MKNASPREIAFFSAGILSLFILGVLLFFNLFLLGDNIAWFYVALIPVANLGIAYFVFLYALERFIYRKIKLIYKTIHSLKAPKGGATKAIDVLEGDVFSRVDLEVKEWAERKKKEIEVLKEIEGYRKDFLGDVSHELKTPIFNIQGYLHTLIDGGIEDEKINKDFLYKAAANVDRLNTIVEDLEFISSFESGTLQVYPEKMDICELINEVIEAMEMQADLYDISIAIKTGCNKATLVEADRERIRQVLTNLVSNSIKYGREEGKTQISVYDMDENVLIEVTDNGIGISKENLPRLFDRFFRVDKSRARERGGTGLGLAIVKHIIEAHQQTINVRSTLGVGSTFGFTLKKAS